jgi:hypothetical protein
MLAAIRRASSSGLILSADPFQASFSEPASPDSVLAPLVEIDTLRDDA